jgi:hypothetical protein
MRKLIFAVSVGAMLSMSLNSCSKRPMPEPAIKQTIDVQLSANQTYTFLLPMNIRDDAYEFTTQALHHELSILDVNAEGQRIYQYTPAKDYVGLDQVVVSNDWEREEHALNGNQQGPPQKMNLKNIISLPSILRLGGMPNLFRLLNNCH